MITPSYRLHRLRGLFFVVLLSFSLPLLSYSSGPTHYSAQEASQRWIPQAYFQNTYSIDFAFNIGLGLLYFHKTRGNLSPIPSALFAQFNGVNFGNIGRLGYNRTPVFEAQIAYRIFPWLKAALVYEGQSGVSVESQFNTSGTPTQQRAWASFRSNLELNSLLIKVYAQIPSAFRIGSMACSPYWALGVGPAWQSWTAPTIYLMTTSQQNNLSSLVMPLRQKITSHALWTGELGLNFQPVQEKAPYTLQMGCKYVDWGSSGSIGVQQQQGAKIAPFKPITIQKVYSFVPFIGIQFNF